VSNSSASQSNRGKDDVLVQDIGAAIWWIRAIFGLLVIAGALIVWFSFIRPLGLPAWQAIPLAVAAGALYILWQMLSVRIWLAVAAFVFAGLVLLAWVTGK
jgi:hypothetical protein